MEITTRLLVFLIGYGIIFCLNVILSFDYDKQHMQIVANDYISIWLRILISIPWLMILGFISLMFSLAVYLFGLMIYVYV